MNYSIIFYRTLGLICLIVGFIFIIDPIDEIIRNWSNPNKFVFLSLIVALPCLSFGVCSIINWLYPNRCNFKQALFIAFLFLVGSFILI
jgi:hypothetical protein